MNRWWLPLYCLTLRRCLYIHPRKERKSQQMKVCFLTHRGFAESFYFKRNIYKNLRRIELIRFLEIRSHGNFVWNQLYINHLQARVKDDFASFWEHVIFRHPLNEKLWPIVMKFSKFYYFVKTMCTKLVEKMVKIGWLKDAPHIGQL